MKTLYPKDVEVIEHLLKRPGTGVIGTPGKIVQITPHGTKWVYDQELSGRFYPGLIITKRQLKRLMRLKIFKQRSIKRYDTQCSFLFGMFDIGCKWDLCVYKLKDYPETRELAIQVALGTLAQKFK